MSDISDIINTEAEEDYTLSDDAWKDSFDKLLEPRPVLRELNLLKKDVRASFNMNSSYENCSHEDSSNFVLPVATPVRLAPPVNRVIKEKQQQSRGGKNQHSISTPVQQHLLANPFKCSLSPIGAWKFRFFDKEDVRKDKQLDSLAEDFHATHINPEIIVSDYDSHQIENYVNDVNGSASSPPFEKTQQNGRQRLRVCFEDRVKEVTDKQSRLLSLEAARNRCSAQSAVQNEQRPTSLTLQPGKWQKSLKLWRRTQLKPAIDNIRKSSVQGKIPTTDDSIQFVSVYIPAPIRKSVYLKNEHEMNTNLKLYSICQGNACAERVLERCEQQKVLPFEYLYSSVAMQDCRKIGEGAYGEVFLNKLTDEDIVLKIIPIEGKTNINGEVQKTYEQILPEIIITMELCKLRDEKYMRCMYAAGGFVDIKRVCCVRGKYPAHLLKLWKAYDNSKGSDNDCPEMLPDKQLYIVLELSFGGTDLEAFVFNNAEQSYYALQQIVLTLAIGEEAYQFEHRDLHWGNILLIATSEKSFKYKLTGKQLTLPSKGVKINIIDYTLSRITYDNCCLYSDLSNDEELFAATGDYQFDIYRMMREVLKNNWEKFEPKTNVFWISYLIAKLLDGVHYKNTRTKTHASYLQKMRLLKAKILSFNSAVEVAKHLRRTI